MADQRTILLDVTRLISRSWTGRCSTGIDRVCYAYLRQYQDSALAVVQHRGAVRVLGRAQSCKLFDLLQSPSKGFHVRFAAFAPIILGSTSNNERLSGCTYINVSHTDFDLPAHWQWVARNGLNPLYFIHDLIPIRHPELTRPHAVKRHLGRVRSALTNRAQIITASNYVAEDIRAFAGEEGLPDPAIVTAPIAGKAMGVTSAKNDGTGGPSFLSLGTIEPRKNYAFLLTVWQRLIEELGDSAPRLTIVGQKGPLSGTIMEPLTSHPELAAKVTWLEKCSDSDLSDLMGRAKALLIPSVAEGFGLPLVEALASGTKVLASDVEVFRETGQGYAQLLPVSDMDAWIAAIITQSRSQGLGTLSSGFVGPQWSDHFATVDRAISSAALQSGGAYESNRAA